MSSEILAVPEEDLEDVIYVIRAGLNEVVVAEHVVEGLENWCVEQEEYLLSLKDED